MKKDYSGFGEWDDYVAEHDYGPAANPRDTENLIQVLANFASDFAALKACIIVLGQQIADLKARLDDDVRRR